MERFKVVLSKIAEWNIFPVVLIIEMYFRISSAVFSFFFLKLFTLGEGIKSSPLVDKLYLLPLQLIA